MFSRELELGAEEGSDLKGAADAEDGYADGAVVLGLGLLRLARPRQPATTATSGMRYAA